MVRINIDDITLSFGNTRVFENFDLDIEKGEIVTLFGPSGCGKSSIIKLVLGIHQPTAGKVLIDEQPAESYGQTIAYVPQENDLLPWLSVKKNVEIWTGYSSNSEMSPSMALSLVGLSDASNKLPSELSGGMARRTALARGLATGSEILCFDEAMVGIEKTLRQQLLLNIRKYIKNQGITGIFISHDHEEAITVSDRIIMLSPPPSSIIGIIPVADEASDEIRNSDFSGTEIYKMIYQKMLI